MRLLVDSDAFCKLGVADLLPETASLFDARIEECGRLGSLHHMLKRGKLPQVYGAETCARLLTIAAGMPKIEQHGGQWIDQLLAVPEVDVGEALLLAMAAERGLPVLTGDMRALRAARRVEGLADALSGRIVVLEAVLIALLVKLGQAELRRRVLPLAEVDTVVGICFSPENHDPDGALTSYLKARIAQLNPLVLWVPREEGDT